MAAPKVLVVDDLPEGRRALGRLLERDGFSVVHAATGEEALSQVRAHEPDVVLLDVVLPDIDGFEVCTKLKEEPHTRLTPVVLVTGLGAIDDRIKGFEVGADDFIMKPFEHTVLLARTKSLVRLKQYTDELEQAESVLFALAEAIEGRDPYTEGHCQRLALFGTRLGEVLGLPDEDITALRRAAVVHDIGKIAIPDAILLKPDRLTEAEMAVMRGHPVLGELICHGLKSFRLVRPIIRHHHERRDGSGYPDGLEGEAIPYLARILQVVDVYDALTTHRPYKDALSPADAIVTLRAEVEKGWWDSHIVEAFCDHHDEILAESAAAGDEPIEGSPLVP